MHFILEFSNFDSGKSRFCYLWVINWFWVALRFLVSHNCVCDTPSFFSTFESWIFYMHYFFWNLSSSMFYPIFCQTRLATVKSQRLRWFCLLFCKSNIYVQQAFMTYESFINCPHIYLSLTLHTLLNTKRTNNHIKRIKSFNVEIFPGKVKSRIICYTSV